MKLDEGGGDDNLPPDRHNAMIESLIDKAMNIQRGLYRGRYRKSNHHGSKKDSDNSLLLNDFSDLLDQSMKHLDQQELVTVLGKVQAFQDHLTQRISEK